jgi:phosphoglycerate dehydrogenase-like enzyme
VSRSRFLVLAPPVDGRQPVLGGMRFLFGGQPYRELAESILSPNGEVRHHSYAPGDPLDEDEDFDTALAEADALVVAPWLPWPGLPGFPVFDAGRFARAPALRAIAGTFDYRLGWLDLDAADAAGVIVIDTSRTMTPTVAEFGVAITFALLRDLPAAIDLVRAGGWPEGVKTEDGFVFRDLADCRIGLAGYGTINRHYRRFVEPYGSDVAIYDPFVDAEEAARDRVELAASLVELARRSDILVVAIPPTPATLGVIDRDVIEALPRGSLFVLLSRMAVVEQEALWDRVQAGELRAAVDVYDPEPPPADAWFRHSENVLPTPHIAGSTEFAHRRCFAEACEDAVRVVGGQPPSNAATTRDKRLYEGTLARAGED